MTRERMLGWWVMGSVVLHGAAIAAVSVVRPALEPAPRRVMMMDLVQAPSPPPPPPAPAPRPAQRPTSLPARAAASTPAPTPPAPKPAAVPNLLDAPALPRAAAFAGPGHPLVPSSLPPTPARGVGAPPAAGGRLFADGDLLTPPGKKDTAGRSVDGAAVGAAAGVRGGGSGIAGAAPAPAGAARSAAVASGTGLTGLARPLGGYQVQPEYPDSARRDRAEGVTVLRLEVLATGKVGDVVVARSAGHRDLDRAAVDAIRRWKFEPARRGATPVAVWVTLPVRFTLSDR